jgi:putative ABC transport system permease protein
MMGESAMATMPLANTIFVDFNFLRLCQNWLMGVVVTSIFTLFPSIKSAWVEPVEALRR